MLRIDCQRTGMLRSGSTGAWVAAAWLLVAGAAAAGDFAGQITASTGWVEGGGNGTVAEGDHLKLGEDGGCSILVDQDAVVELCGDSSLVLRKDKRKRIVELDRGEIRLVVEPRDIEARVEIHTPAVVATLLGTIVHVTVDERTGETTISSAESKVAVRSADPRVRGTTVVETAHQVTVKPGQAPPAKPKRLTRDQIASLGGCLADFHSAALGRDTGDHRERVAQRLAVFDLTGNGGLGMPLSMDGVPGIGDPITSQEGICVSAGCGADIVESHEPSESQQPPSTSQSSNSTFEFVLP